MLRDELDFKLRMRASLRGIVQLDPVTIPVRLAELDREIRALEARLGTERAGGRGPAAPVAGLRAA